MGGRLALKRPLLHMAGNHHGAQRRYAIGPDTIAAMLLETMTGGS